METVATLIDKLTTASQKLFLFQEKFFKIRHMTLEQFKAEYFNEKGIEEIFNVMKRSMDLNLQRQQMILEVDKKISEMIGEAIKGKELDEGVFIQDQHKTY